jgi:type IV pilus assembly protein PilB
MAHPHAELDPYPSNISIEVGAQMQSTPAIGEAIQQLPRRDFVGFTGGTGGKSLVDVPLTRTPPTAVIAAMLGGLEIAPEDRVLQVGTGTGYPAALLAMLTSHVDTIDLRQERIDSARELFLMAGMENVEFHVGDGFRTQFDNAPFDAILVSALAEKSPTELLGQLTVGGRMVVPIRLNRRKASLIRVRRLDDSSLQRELLGTAEFVSRLGDLLVDFSILPRPYVERAGRRAQSSGKRLGELLLDDGAIDEQTLYHLLSIQHGIRTGSVRALLHGATTEYFDQLPERYMQHTNLLPVKMVGDTLVAATTEPRPSSTELEAVLDAPNVEPYLVTPTAFQRIWSALDSGRIREGLQEASKPTLDSKAGASPEIPDLGMVTAGAPRNEYAELFSSILLDAVDERASDIHFERYGRRVRIRFRVDGELRDVERYDLTKNEYRGLINVIKIAAGLDIAERRLPQGGRLERTIDGEMIDLRVQTQPTLDEEFCVIRLLPQDRDLLSIADLGFPDGIAAEYQRLVESPNGLILVVGPTGSGKSTTLYAGLQVLVRDAKKKVITVEDPIEYSIDGIEQTQARPNIGFSFADAMRSFVRQDPDAIMVGEIRDKETALEAIRASQTGHLVLSTLHCNDSVDAVQRLYDLGMQPNSIASELVGVFAQRLAKRICTNCRKPATPDDEIMEELFPGGPPSDFTAYQGRGCARCGGTGTRGRIAVVEALPVGPEIRRAIARELPLDDLRAEAEKAGLQPLRRHALELVEEGLIPLAELPRILSVEAMAPTEYSGSDTHR